MRSVRVRPRLGFLILVSSVSVSASVLSIPAHVALAIQAAPDQIPSCLERGQPLAVNNQEVLQWKDRTPNQYQDRARVRGRIVREGRETPSHERLVVQIGPDADDLVEIVYNSRFGRLPRVSPGMRVEVCGDYITSNADSGRYRASPQGAIIHWIHMNPDRGGHEDGYLWIEGRLFGHELPPEARSRGRSPRRRPHGRD